MQRAIVGLDVGSTTVKAVVVHPETKEILWDDYQRHHTKQAECVLDFMVRIGDVLKELGCNDTRVFVTGSGAAPLEEPLGAKFVQEVNSVTLAVETLHPDAGSVVELGGQDAKIIIFKENVQTGDKSAIASMNDKCASGTGATIDKCMIKVGMPSEETLGLHFNDQSLHHVAAKCGVFAETDIVNLVKTGIPSDEIMCSLADAIVMQNLSVLTRGNTLRHKVLLLGGPNTFLPFLQECWRKRIPETWDERGYDYPKDVPIEELIPVPDNAALYAAYGAVMYGMHEPSDVGVYNGLGGLERYINEGRKERLGESAGPPLSSGQAELDRFLEAYRIPQFAEPELPAGGTVKAVIGLDGGSTSSKAVLLGEDGEVLMKSYALSKGNPIQDAKELLEDLRTRVRARGAELDILGFGATGYAADVLEECVCADVNVVETVAHMMSATHYFGDIDVICDIGGQDIKVLFMENGDIKTFKLSNQCSAGNGMLLQAMADQFGLPVQEYAENAFQAELAPKFSYGCAVFLDTDRVNFQKEGFGKEELLAGLAQVLPKNVWQYVVGVPRMAALGRKFVLQGGTQYNLAAVKAQVDYINERVPNAEVFVHPHSGEAGAIGAAMETLRVVKRRGHSTFIGLDAAIDLKYETKNDETTTCHFCANECSRTFIDAFRPDGTTSRYISGFSCEKGMVESKDAMEDLVKERRKILKEFPNLVTYEGLKAFKRISGVQSLPEAGTEIDDVKVDRKFFGSIERTKYRRGFRRSSEAAAEKRASWRVGIPRVLNMYSTAPFFRTYLEVLGVRPKNIVFSDPSSEEMFAEGGKYGSVDPCYPSKVAQAHFHQLFFHKHAKTPLDAIFFPILTHVPSFVTDAVDYASCPIVAGTPDVMKAAFTKEQDYFETRGITYMAPAFSFAEPTLLQRSMFEAFRDALEITEDESDFAVTEGLAALERFDEDVQAKGKAILDQVEYDNKIAILVVGRQYHLDPGLHHNIPDEFQVLGYPILSIRSIPKDPEWLGRFYEDGEDALSINDVWPENYSAASAQKVWAVKFAARHPNVAILDLSSFKCGHDAPTYGIIDSIVSSSGVPAASLHDIDANKPGGSIKIRVKTYAHSLRLREEHLEDVAARKAELERRIDEKRLELLRMKQAQLSEHRRADLQLERQIKELAQKVMNYRVEAAKSAEDEVVAEMSESLIRLGKKTKDGNIVRV
ncbi:MAG: acyl-CoA dehydratase activase-related protein [Myxococcales bacterium]|nr:acyl-CoA dehydratase activase-related protein [Myxococcales bacterium]MDH3483128.1 acyl-CoA dehydratase activase-related protein [Myxococcales bacterium]